MLAGDGLGEQLAGQVRGVHPVAGIGLGEVHVGLVGQPADLRQAIGADADHPAPLIVDTYIGELWEHLEHLRSHIGGDILRITPGIVAGAAEQQPAIGGQTVIVQGHALVADGHVLRQQLAGLGLAQGFGGDDVAAGGQHLAAKLGIQVVQVGVATQHQGAGMDGPVGGVHPHLRAIVDPCHRRLLEQTHAQLAGDDRFAQGQVKRMQMSRAHVDQATNVAVRADYAVHLLRLHQA
ncbi:hypothetical protein D3C76_1178570 [compost metagenome]